MRSRAEPAHSRLSSARHGASRYSRWSVDTQGMNESMSKVSNSLFLFSPTFQRTKQIQVSIRWLVYSDAVRLFVSSFYTWTGKSWYWKLLQTLKLGLFQYSNVFQT